MEEQEQAAVEAVARHFLIAWEKGEGSPDAYLVAKDRRIAVDVVMIDHGGMSGSGLGKLRLRFDKVAVRFVKRLQTALNQAVPDGQILMVTVTAPIRVAVKTAVELEERIRLGLTDRSVPVAFNEAIHGNQIRVRSCHTGLADAPPVIGFVHNPDTDPDFLLDLVQSFAVPLARSMPQSRITERWMIVNDLHGNRPTEVYRHVCSLLSIPEAFKKILMVSDSGRVESLLDQAGERQAKQSA